MRMGTLSRAALVRTSSVAAVLLVAAATRADVAASSRTGNQPPDSKKGKDAVSAQSSSGKASATSQPSLSAVTEKKGNNDPNQNGSNASFSDRARVVNGAGKAVRLSFGFSGAVTCSSEPGKINSATASARGGVIGRGGGSCMITCTGGVPVSFEGCGGGAVRAKISNVSTKTTTKIPLTPDDLEGLGIEIKTTYDPENIGEVSLLAAAIAQAIKLRGLNKYKIPPGTDVDISFDVQFFKLLPPTTVDIAGSSAAVVASVNVVAGALLSSYAKAEAQGSGSAGRSGARSFVGLAQAPSNLGLAVLSATTKGPVPAGMKVVFDTSPDEIEVRAETECSDGLDNDGDGFADFPEDRGCEDPFSPTENPAVLPTDFDNDMIFDSADNCPSVFNPLQEDQRGANPGSPPDGIGDACQ